MRFINYGFMIRYSRMFISFPIKIRIYYNGLRNIGCTVFFTVAKVLVLMVHIISKQAVMPLYCASDRLATRIHQKFMRIEPMTILWHVGPIDTVYVHLPRL